MKRLKVSPDVNHLEIIGELKFESFGNYVQ